MTKEIKEARAAVNAETFGTITWEEKMQVVRNLVANENAARANEEFCSVDSGWHRTRLADGRVV